MKNDTHPRLTIAEIFDQYVGEYLKENQVSNRELKVINDILRCRTIECGMHQRVCLNCGVIGVSCNSCRNRHCPNCQQAQKHKWLEERKKELLPVPYFHLVFTLPHQLNAIVIRNKSFCYRLLFECVWSTILHFSANPKWLGAKTGCIAVLHTWGQNLSFHPHIHCIMPSGGITADGFEWLHTHPKYFAPVSELSKKFKTEYLTALNIEKQNLKLSCDDTQWNDLMQDLQQKSWVVFAQPSFTEPDYVIDYLGNYTHKIAISNHRLIKIAQEKVYFHWKDYKDDGKKKIMHLPVMEFIRRFLEHVLPYNFYKIRYFGIFANRFKTIHIQNARACLQAEGKNVDMEDRTPKQEINLPQGCPYMGPCHECAGPTISWYHYQMKIETERSLLLQSG